MDQSRKNELGKEVDMLTYEVCIVGMCGKGNVSVGRVASCEISGEVPEFTILIAHQYYVVTLKNE